MDVFNSQLLGISVAIEHSVFQLSEHLLISKLSLQIPDAPDQQHHGAHSQDPQTTGEGHDTPIQVKSDQNSLKCSCCDAQTVIQRHPGVFIVAVLPVKSPGNLFTL